MPNPEQYQSNPTHEASSDSELFGGEVAPETHYLDEWSVFGHTYPELRGRARKTEALLRKNRDRMHEADTASEDYDEKFRIVKSWYRRIKQDSELIGAEKDLERAAVLVALPLLKQEGSLNPDHVSEAISILADWSRTTDSETSPKIKGVAYEIANRVVDDKSIPWTDERKLNVASIAFDMRFDSTFQQYRLLEEGDHEEYAKITEVYDDNMAKQINIFHAASAEIMSMPEGTRDEVLKKTETIGQLFESAMLIYGRHRASENETMHRFRIRHATNRQDAGFDGISGDKKQLSNNIDLIIEKYDNEGMYSGKDYLQLKMKNSEGKQYRRPIKVIVMEEMNFQDVINSIEAIGHLYTNSEHVRFTAADKEKIEFFSDRLIDESTQRPLVIAS